MAAAGVVALGSAAAISVAVRPGPAPHRAAPVAPVAQAAAWPVVAEPSLFDGHTLLRQDGQPFELRRLHGKTVLLNIAFTQCSTTCPVTTRQLVQLQHRLAAQAGHEVEFVTLSADPLSDTPASLEAYARAQGADVSRWHWLTGDAAKVHALIESLTGRPTGVGKPEEHLTALLMIDAYGRRIGRFHGVDVDQPRLERELLQLDRGLGRQARSAGRGLRPGV